VHPIPSNNTNVTGRISGFVLVPLNAHIQFLSPSVHLGTILAGSNYIQNIFMFSFLVLTTLFAYFGMNAELLFYLMALVGLYLSYMMLKRYFVMTFFATMELISRTRHKYSYEGLENIPRDKAVLFLGNHVSWLDWIILQIPMKRKINFMMDKEIYHWPLLNAMFRKGETIPLSPRASKDAFKEAHTRLKDGKVVAIYPEGGISKDGELGTFYRGYEMITQNYDGVIIPFYIDGLFGSMFSKHKPHKKKNFFKRRDVKVYFSTPVPKEIKAEKLKNIIQGLKEKYESN